MKTYFNMKTYFKFLGDNKLYTAIEAMGLAVSLAFVTVIGSHVWQQFSTSRENPYWERTYGLGTKSHMALSWWDKEAIDMEIPEVEASTRLETKEGVLTFGERLMHCKTTAVDKEFWEMFPDHGITTGSVAAMDVPDNVLISESLAAKLSEEGEDLIGRELDIDGSPYTIGGIFSDFGDGFLPEPDVIRDCSQSVYAKYSRLRFKLTGSTLTLFRVKEGTDREQLTKKVQDLCLKNYGNALNEGEENPYIIQNLRELYFNPNASYVNHTSKPMLYTLLAIVLMLLVSSVFNYINLNVALTSKRAKEMATRRLLGEGKTQVFLRYILESLLFTIVCLMAALLLAKAFAPMVGRLLSDPVRDSAVHISVALTPGRAAIYLCAAIVVGCLAGLIPASIASGFRPIDVVRGAFQRRSKMTFSRIFITLQTVIAVGLIAVALVMEAQNRHMLRRPYPMNSDNLFFLMGEHTYGEDALRDRLAQLPGVSRIGQGTSVPGNIGLSYGFKDENEDLQLVPLIDCDSTYFNLLGLQLIQDFGHPLTGSFFISESLYKFLQASDNTEVKAYNTLKDKGVDYIGGVYRDIPTRPANSDKDNPFSAVRIPSSGFNTDLFMDSGLLISTTDGDKATGDAILGVYKAYVEEQDGIYTEPHCSGFLNDIRRNALATTMSTMRLLELFMALAVIIALLGLVAMSTYFADGQTKGIAIRKVFGSTVAGETRRSISGYMALTLIACVIGIPIAAVACDRYMQGFAYKVSGYWWAFLAAAVIAAAMAFASVLWQVFRAASTNPVTELKKE